MEFDPNNDTSSINSDMHLDLASESSGDSICFTMGNSSPTISASNGSFREDHSPEPKSKEEKEQEESKMIQHGSEDTENEDLGKLPPEEGAQSEEFKYKEEEMGTKEVHQQMPINTQEEESKGEKIEIKMENMNSELFTAEKDKKSDEYLPSLHIQSNELENPNNSSNPDLSPPSLLPNFPQESEEIKEEETKRDLAANSQSQKFIPEGLGSPVDIDTPPMETNLGDLVINPSTHSIEERSERGIEILPVGTIMKDMNKLQDLEISPTKSPHNSPKTAHDLFHNEREVDINTNVASVSGVSQELRHPIDPPRVNPEVQNIIKSTENIPQANVKVSFRIAKYPVKSDSEDEEDKEMALLQAQNEKLKKQLQKRKMIDQMKEEQANLQKELADQEVQAMKKELERVKEEKDREFKEKQLINEERLHQIELEKLEGEKVRAHEIQLLEETLKNERIEREEDKKRQEEIEKRKEEDRLEQERIMIEEERIKKEREDAIRREQEEVRKRLEQIQKEKEEAERIRLEEAKKQIDEQNKEKEAQRIEKKRKEEEERQVILKNTAEQANYYGIRKRIKLDSGHYETFSLETNFDHTDSSKLTDEVQFFHYIAPMFFTLLKKHYLWDNIFTQSIVKKVKTELKTTIWRDMNSKLFLYSFLNSASSQLKIKILRDYSTMAPIPFVAPVWKDDFQDIQFKLNEELLWILESYELLVSYGPENTKIGKSYYLNKLFKTTFFIEDMPAQFSPTIDIYLDAYKGTAKKIAIIDINSNSDQIIVDKLLGMAKFLLLHTTQDFYKKNPKYIDKFEKIPKIILIRDIENIEDMDQNNNKYLEYNQSVEKHLLWQFLPSVDKIKKNSLDFQEHLDYVNDFIYKNTHQMNSLQKLKFYESFLLKSINPKNKNMFTYINKFREIREYLLCNKDKLNSNNVLSIVPRHKRFCEIDYFLMHKSAEATKEVTENLEMEKSALEAEMKNNKSTYPKKLIILFIEATKCEDFNSYFLFDIAQEIKNIVDEETGSSSNVYAKLKHFQQDIKCKGKEDYEKLINNKFTSLSNLINNANKLLGISDKINPNISQKNILSIIEKKLHHLDNLRIKTEFSLDILWRELIYLYIYQPKNILFKEFSLHKFFMKSLNYGYPFEIIDGDNLYFPTKFYKEALGIYDNKRILVVSIIGPQSSGKSTLLNFLFGCNFQTSAGRCTRGIYGTYIKLTDINNYDGIFILDTEGLLSIHHAQSSNDFDRKITLFILAVSQVVVINIKGEMQGPVLELLTICINSLIELKENKVPSPEIFIVLNQYTDLSTKNIDDDIITVIDAMGNIMRERQIGLNDVISLNQKNVKALPNAFKQKTYDLMDSEERINYKIPEFAFVEKTKIIAQELIQMAILKQNDNENSLPYDNLSRWFSFAENVWNVITTFPTLVYYHSIKQETEEKEMEQWINAILTKEFEDKTMQKYLLKSSRKIPKIEKTAERFILSLRQFFEPTATKIKQEFEKKFKNLQFIEKGIISNKSRLEIRLEQIYMDYESYVNAKFITDTFQHIRKYGESRLNMRKNELLSKSKQLTKENAKIEFDNIWNNIIIETKSKLDRIENSKKLLEGLMITYQTIYRHFEIQATDKYFKQYQNLNYTQIVTSLINIIKENEKPFINTTILSKSTQEDNSKEYIDINNCFKEIEVITYIPKDQFAKCIHLVRIRDEIANLKKTGFLHFNLKERDAAKKLFPSFSEDFYNCFKVRIAENYFLKICPLDIQEVDVQTGIFQEEFDLLANNLMGSQFTPNISHWIDSTKLSHFIQIEKGRELGQEFIKENIIFNIEVQYALKNELKKFTWLKSLKFNNKLPHYRDRSYFCFNFFNWVKLFTNINSIIEDKLFIRGICREVNTPLIVEMANNTNQFIKIVNENLIHFGLELDQHCISNFHLCILLSIWKANEETKWRELEQPYKNLLNSKQDQLDAFVAELTEDYIKSNEITSLKIIKLIGGNLSKIVEQKLYNKFDNKIRQKQDDLGRSALQDELDQEYMFDNTTDVQRGIDYLDNFVEIMNERFEQKFAPIEHILFGLIRIVKIKALDLWKELEDRVYSLIVALKGQNLPSSSSNLFAVVSEEEDLEGVWAKKYDRQICKAAIQYFYDYLCGNKVDMWIIDNIKISPNPNLETKLPFLEAKLMPENQKIIIKDYFQNESTSRLDIFLYNFLQFIGKEREEWKNLDMTIMSEKLSNHINSKKEELRNSAKGCTAKCPTCKKYCDKVHTGIAGTEEDPHSCYKGHQVRALAGNKLHNEQASVFCCEEMEPDDPVTLDAGKPPILWSEYIKQISKEALFHSNCWNFNELLLRQANREQNIHKFKAFWELIGEEFCIRETNKGNKILMCKESNKEKFSVDGGPIHSHVILALDSSGIYIYIYILYMYIYIIRIYG